MRKTEYTSAVWELEKGVKTHVNNTKGGTERKKVRAYHFSFVVMTERPTKWEIKGADGSHTHALWQNSTGVGTRAGHVNSHRVNVKYAKRTKHQTKFKTVVINWEIKTLNKPVTTTERSLFKRWGTFPSSPREHS